jgi:hypothetical protein
MLYQEIIRKLENTDPCYFDNCLLLANFLRESFNLSSFPESVMQKAEVFENSNFKFIHKYFENFGIRTNMKDAENFDVILMSFSGRPCLGTYIDGFIFYLDGLGMGHQKMENMGTFILYIYRMK